MNQTDCLVYNGGDKISDINWYNSFLAQSSGLSAFF